ncbi:hypothetical protein ACU5P1_22745 [Pseudomonas plecoglossicida]|nr:hypothetical protein [Pseudomonas plecoglossicida]
MANDEGSGFPLALMVTGFFGDDSIEGVERLPQRIKAVVGIGFGF